eukprot:gene39651-52298_t
MEFLDMLNEAEHELTSLSPKQKSLFQASSKGDLLQVQSLLDELTISNFVFNGFSPLHIASKKNHGEVVKVLAENSRTLISMETTDGRTALMIASFEGHVDVLLALLPYVALYERDKMGNTSLHYAAWGGHL